MNYFKSNGTAIIDTKLTFHRAWTLSRSRFKFRSLHASGAIEKSKTVTSTFPCSFKKYTFDLNKKRNTIIFSSVFLKHFPASLVMGLNQPRIKLQIKSYERDTYLSSSLNEDLDKSPQALILLLRLLYEDCGASSLELLRLLEGKFSAWKYTFGAFCCALGGVELGVTAVEVMSSGSAS